MTPSTELIMDLHQKVRGLKEQNKELQAKVDDIPNFAEWINQNEWAMHENGWLSPIMEGNPLKADDLYKKYLTETA